MLRCVRRFAVLLLALLPAACGERPGAPVRVLEPVDFDELPGFRLDDPRPALTAFLRGCRALARRPAAAPVDETDPRFGRFGDWQRLCREAARLEDDPAAVRTFFTTRFRRYCFVMNGC